MVLGFGTLYTPLGLDEEQFRGEWLEIEGLGVGTVDPLYRQSTKKKLASRITQLLYL